MDHHHRHELQGCDCGAVETFPIDTRSNQVEEQRVMNRAAVDGVELEYEILGAGETVVLVHAGVLPHWFKPLLKQPVLTTRYRLVSYHRAGYAGSSRMAGPV